MNELLAKIKRAIVWYEGVSRSSQDYYNLHILNQFGIRLSTRLYELAELVGEIKQDFDATYGNRKINVNKTKVELMDGGDTATKAESRAIVENAEIIKKEKELEGLYYRLRLLLTQGNEVLGRLNQHISNLKNEKDG